MQGSVVLYHWIQFLQDSCLDCLGIDGVLLAENSKIQKILLAYNDVEQKQEFDCCCICFMEIKGTDFEVITECRHSYCRKCLSQHCKSKLEDGEMTSIKCPDPDCKAPVDGSVVKSLIPEKLFEQYDKNLLNFALRSMSSTVWCPRLSCQYPAQSQENLNLGECPQCSLAFCLKCHRAYHGTGWCKEDEPRKPVHPSQVKSFAQILQDQKGKDLLELEQIMSKKGVRTAIMHAVSTVNSTFSNMSKKEKQDLVRTYRSLSATKKNKLFKQYGQPHVEYFASGGIYDRQHFFKFLGDLTRESAEQARKTNQEEETTKYDMMAAVFVSEAIKCCPLCMAPIEKNGGCHHMHCRLCNGHFCWDCSQSMQLCSETKCNGKYLRQ